MNPNVLIIVLTYLSLFCLGLTDNLRGTLFPEILQTFSLTNSMGSYLFIITSLFSILASFTSPRWLQRYDTIKVWRWGIFLMGIGAFGIFLSPRYSLLLLSCAVLGLGFGILAVTQNLLITVVSPSTHKKRILSGLHSMYGFAAFLSPLLVRELIQNHSPWKNLFLIASSLILLLYFVSFIIPQGSVCQNTLAPNTPNTPNAPENDLKTYDKRKPLMLSVVISCYICIELLISTRMTSYLKFNNHWSLSEGTLYLTYFFIGLLLGRVIFSFFHPPLSTKKMLLISLMGSLMLITLGLRMNPIFLSLSGLLLAPFYPLAIALISELFPNQVSSVLGRTVSLQSLFFISMNLTVGYWTDFFGIASAMNAVYFFGAVAWFLLIKL